MPQKRRDARDYDWNQLEGLRAILDFASKRVRGSEVVIDRLDDARNKYGPLWGAYGSRMSYTDEAIEFDDGHILVCGTVSSWAGTFASHDDISVRYYELIPHQAPKPDRKIRKEKK